VPFSRVFLDTSFVVALENRDDPFHERAKQLDRELVRDGCILALHWGILLEIGDGYARLDRRAKGCQILERLRREVGYLVFPLSDSLLEEAGLLFEQRLDKAWGLTDCVSFTLMHREGIAEALTADAHFCQAGFKPLLLE
jgi:predicted nucleic acid-binding protein